LSGPRSVPGIKINGPRKGEFKPTKVAWKDLGGRKEADLKEGLKKWWLARRSVAGGFALKKTSAATNANVLKPRRRQG